MSRWHYYRRIFQAYLGTGPSQLTFWYDTPEPNLNATFDSLGEYYMPFTQKSDYPGFHDAAGIPMLDYRGSIGRQYNPIAIAQWGLGNYNQFLRAGCVTRKKKFLLASDWLCANPEQNSFGVHVWQHCFDWEYRSTLKAPWYSALAQGQGISLLLRAHRATRDNKYLQSASFAFGAFLKSVDQGGVTFSDTSGNVWFEEYIVNPPTHILNGLIWAAWGVYDYFLAAGATEALDLFRAAVRTLRHNLHHYDLGFWSLYEQSGKWLPMVASPYYHRLHIAQLRVMQRMTGDEVFGRFADRWESYAGDGGKRVRALGYKTVFKLAHY